MLRIFTHNDADGYAAGYLVHKYFDDKKHLRENEYKYYFMDYSKEFPLNEIKKDDIIFITDFSINPEDMIKLLRITPYVVWIDHHISSIEKYNDWNELIKLNAQRFSFGGSNFTIDGLRMNDISGCALTWLYLYQGWTEKQKLQEINDIGEEKTLNDMMKDFEKAPMWLQSINDWDVWNLKYEFTKPFITSLNNRLSINNIKLLGDENDTDLKYFDIHIKEGKLFLSYRDNWAAQLREKYGYESSISIPDKNGEINLYKCYCLNVGNANSDYSGKQILDKYDFVVHYAFNGERFVYSLYSTKDEIDCSYISKFLGVDNGGGHKGAAGFTHKELIFKKEN